jgi:hypothetical protein
MTDPVDQHHPIRALVAETYKGSLIGTHCEAILDALDVPLPRGDGTLGFGDFLDMTSAAEVTRELISAAIFLSTCRHAIFNAFIVLLGEEDGDDIELDADDAARAASGEPIEHPRTGETIQNSRERCAIRYRRTA